jgi:hypothetical protein
VPQNRRGRFSARGGATFPDVVAVQALAVRRSAAASSSLLRAISLSVLHAAHRDQCVRRDDARKLLDAGVEELRWRRLVEIADAQHFPRVPTR